MFEEKMYKAKWYILLAGLLLIIAILIVGINVCLPEKEEVLMDEDEYRVIYMLSDRFSVSPEYVQQRKEELGGWEQVGYRLMQEEHMFKPERATELLRQGYLKEDMVQAQQLELETGVDRELILARRGTYPGQNSWKDVKKGLKLDCRSDAEKLGMSKATIKVLKGNGVKEHQIVELALKVKNKKITKKSIVDTIKAGESVDDLLNE